MSNRIKLTDDSPMPFGQYKGKALANVPDNYLLYIHEKGWDEKYDGLSEYIVDNLDNLDTKEHPKCTKCKYILRNTGSILECPNCGNIYNKS